MTNRSLALSLAHADSEDEVVDVLKDAGHWDVDAHWRLYGDNESNYSLIGNQQRDPDAALVEKIVNSVDAVLLDEARRRGMNPEGEEAPQSISDALQEFFDIYEGQLANVGASQRSELASRIGLVATGRARSPSFTIVDSGEGQRPSDFPRTFLSLPQESSNKLRIPFVQGKFNMGGTGALPFCGDRNLQFILSRRNPDIVEMEGIGSDCPWGFTVVRKRFPAGGVRNPIYEYLAPDQAVPSFVSDGLPLEPGVEGEAYGGQLEWGSFVKLYEYDIGSSLRTNILFDLYNRVSLLLPRIALPTRFYERRSHYSGHSLESTLSGLSVRLEDDRSGNLETTFTGRLRVQGNTLKTRCYLFEDAKAAGNYRGNEVALFTVNGQTHGALDGRFFNRKSLGKIDYLSDSILVLVDCSDLDLKSRTNLFMPSRDRLRSSQFRSDLLDELERFLASHDGLKEIANRRRREAIEERVSDSKPLEQVLKSLINRSPSLAKLFSEGERLANPFAPKGVNKDEEFDGREYPTYFELTREFTEEEPKPCPVNRRYRVQYATDAENGYLDRDRYGGEFTLAVNGGEVDDYSINLWKGTANLNVSLPDDAEVGELLHYESTVTDPQQIEPFKSEWWVEVAEKEAKRSGTEGKRKAGPSDDEGEDSDAPSRLSLPQVTEVDRGNPNWERFEFDERTALVAKRAGEQGYDFYVNVDNVALKTEQKRSSREADLLKAQYKYGLTLLGIAYLKDASNGAGGGPDEAEEEMSEEVDPLREVRRVTRSLAPVIIPMVESLGRLDPDDV